jgi:hypothetical protein
MDFISRIPRDDQPGIARSIEGRLSQRKASGQDEPSLDVFIPELNAAANRLDAHVAGKTLANAARATRVAHRDRCDDSVDTWCRHIEGFLSIEGHRRTGPHVADALALHNAAFPDGLTHLDDPVVEQNVHCSASLSVLREPEHAATIEAIGLPVAWIGAFEDALNASKAAQEEVSEARADKSVHVELGRDAEAEWADVMRRLRKQITSRGKRGGVEKAAEGLQLLEPLLSAIQKLESEYAARVTRRSKKGAPTAPVGSGAAPTAPVGSGVTPAAPPAVGATPPAPVISTQPVPSPVTETIPKPVAPPEPVAPPVSDTPPEPVASSVPVTPPAPASP